LNNILIEFGIHINLVRLIKMCLTETYSRLPVGKHLCDTIDIKMVWKRNDLSPLRSSVAISYRFRRVEVNQDSLKLNVTYQLLVYCDDVNILRGSEYTVKKNILSLVFASNQTWIEIYSDKNYYMIIYEDQDAGRSDDIKIENNSFGTV